jgi:hypothetical protein
VDHPGRNLDTCRLEALAEKVFDRLDVVVGRALQLFDAARIGEREVAVQGAQTGRRSGVESELFDRRIFGQCDQPFDFDPDAVADECELAEVGGQRPRARAVAAVDRRHRHQRCIGFESLDFANL